MTRSRVRGCAGAQVAGRRSRVAGRGSLIVDRGSWIADRGSWRAIGDRRQAAGGRPIVECAVQIGCIGCIGCVACADRAADVACFARFARSVRFACAIAAREAARRQDSFGRRTHRGSRAIDGLRRPAWPSRRPTCSDPGLAITGCIACRRFPGECRAASRCTATRVRCPNVRPCRFSPGMKRRWCMPTPDSRTASWPDSACERATAASGRTWRRTRRPASRRRSMPGCAPRRRIGVDNVDDIEND